MSINPEDIDAWDRGCVTDYTFNAFYVMQEMTDYLPELEKGETPRNVYAMWLSDVFED